MNSCTSDAIYVCTSSICKVGVWQRATCRNNTDNNVETIVFGNTDIFHPCNDTVSKRNVAESSSLYITYLYIYTKFFLPSFSLIILNRLPKDRFIEILGI